MIELHTLLYALNSASSTNVAVLLEIIKGIYRIGNGGVTMKNISRWTPAGCSYRTIQRFFSHGVDWLSLNILLFQSAYYEEGDKERYLLAFDETVEDKAGKSTWGVNWFYSSIASKVIRSVSSHVVSLVDSKKETSFVITHEQTVKSEKKKTPRKRKTRNKSSKQQKKASVSKNGSNKFPNVFFDFCMMKNIIFLHGKGTQHDPTLKKDPTLPPPYPPPTPK